MVTRFKRDGKFNILFIATLLLALLVASVGVANAWFVASHRKGLQIIMQLGQMKILLYQEVSGNEILIKTNGDNAKEDDPTYITLEKEEIVPDEENELKLILENDDLGSGTYLRFKFEIYTQQVRYDDAQQKYVKHEVKVPVNVMLGDSIVKSGDYYYYGTVDNEGNLTDSIFFEKTSDDPVRLTLMTGFEVPYSSFDLLEGSETVKLVLNIEGSNVKY